jgi:prophage regulatory protein
MQEEVLWRLPQVEAATGYRRSNIYRLVKRGEFPAPIKIGVRASAWAASSVRSWITEKIERGRKAELREAREGAPKSPAASSEVGRLSPGGRREGDAMDSNKRAPGERGAGGTAVCSDGRDPITAAIPQGSPNPTPAAALLIRLSAEFSVFAQYRPLAIGIDLAMCRTRCER